MFTMFLSTDMSKNSADEPLHSKLNVFQPIWWGTRSLRSDWYDRQPWLKHSLMSHLFLCMQTVSHFKPPGHCFASTTDFEYTLCIAWLKTSICTIFFSQCVIGYIQSPVQGVILARQLVFRPRPLPPRWTFPTMSACLRADVASSTAVRLVLSGPHNVAWTKKGLNSKQKPISRTKFP